MSQESPRRATKKKARRPPGRPEHKPTTVTRRKVAAAAGGGMIHDEIAVALGISKPTLEKYYGAELHQMAFQKRLDVLDAHHRAAMRGNVSAQKAYLARVPTAAVAPVAPEIPLGKKDQANADAVGAETGTSWDGLLAPRGPAN